MPTVIPFRARRKPARRVERGDVLLNGHLSDLHVQAITSNSQGSVVLLCAYRPGEYPATTLILQPDEIVPVR